MRTDYRDANANCEQIFQDPTNHQKDYSLHIQIDPANIV